MHWVLIIVGAFVGGWIADIGEELLGFFAGAVIGYLLAQVFALKRRLAQLEEAQPARRRGPAKPTQQPASRTGWSDEPEIDASPTAPPPAAVAARSPSPAAADASSGTTGWSDPAPAKASTPPPRKTSADGPPSVAPPPRGPDPLERLISASRRWITTGNVPVKVGVVISFFGVAFLLKYAVDRELLTLPIELRLFGVALGAIAMLAVGWRLRQSNAVYALSLQGGGIGILYLTIFSAFRLYDVVPATMAFVLLVALTIGVGVLAVLQNARWLAIFGTVGGFLAPILTSTGQGSHVALFSYYLLLNAAILGISWFRAWRSLNLLGFLFTFGIGTLWGYRYYRPELYASTQPFLILYFLFYQAIAVLFAFRQAPKLRGLVDGTILFGTPVIAFALQSRLVADTEYGLAISAAAVALFYVLVAGWLYRAHRDTLKLMIESYVALAVAFATIAIPLALDARWTAAAWALEGAALVWVGVRQSGVLARLAGAALLVASGLSFVESGWQSGAGIPVLNGNALGGLLISAASLFAAFRLHRDERPLPLQALLSIALLVWGLLWWFGTGAAEIDDRVSYARSVDVYLLFAAASACCLARLARGLDWRAAAHATLAYLPLLPLIAVMSLFRGSHLLADLGWLAWPASLIAHLYLLRLYDADGSGRGGLWHAAGALFFTAVVTLEVDWFLDHAQVADAWSHAGALAVPILAGWGLMALRPKLAWPLQRYSGAYLGAAATMLTLATVVLIGVGIDDPGNPAPLPYVPVLNPYDAATLIALVVTLRCLLLAQQTSERVTPENFRVGLGLWGAAAFLLTTIAVVRGVHHLLGVPWSQGTLLGSTSVQAALSIYWGLLGFGGMVLGARRAQRFIWLLGTGMMALVVAKLFLVDLGNTGTVARIVSFLGVGVLLLVVGYFAPAPPRAAAGADGDAA